MDWMPIEICPRTKGRYSHLAAKVSEKWCYATATWERVDTNKWAWAVRTSSDGAIHCYLGWEPTHWAPVPNAPGEDPQPNSFIDVLQRMIDAGGTP